MEQREVFSMQAEAGQFEILAITAGEGNGWEFGEHALRNSLPLWDGVECFIDHTFSGHSVRDLAGVCHAPEWDDSARGIRLKLKPAGPGAALLAEMGGEMLEGGEPLPRVGFSADLIFSAEGRCVQKVLRVLSVDLVFDPARGGKFLRKITGAQLAVVGAQIQSIFEEKEKPMSDSTDLSDLRQELQTARREMCQAVLDTRLSAAHLPAPVNERLRGQFNGTVFAPQALDDAIADARRMVSDLTAAASVQGLPAISGMVTGEDQFTAAAHDLLGAQRPKELEGVQVARLSGIRELYVRMTGDVDFHGGYDTGRAQFSTALDLPGMLKNVMNKLIISQWEELGRSGYRWWEPLVSVEHFNSLQQITGVLVGEITTLPSVAEGAPYNELDVSDSSETGNWGKYGGYVALTAEMFERDETHKLRQYPRKLASAALRRISGLVGSIFTGSGGVGPNMSDGYAVFEAAHHANLGTAALTSGAWETACKAIYNQSMRVADGGSAPRLALDARYCVVPRDLRLTAMQILYPSFAHEANIFSENMQRGEMGDVITCPEFSDASDWAAVADPRLAPGIIVGERFGLMPEIFIADQETSGALFTNDEIRMKVRHWVSVFVADYRPLYKSNAA